MVRSLLYSSGLPPRFVSDADPMHYSTPFTSRIGCGTVPFGAPHTKHTLVRSLTCSTYVLSTPSSPTPVSPVSPVTAPQSSIGTCSMAYFSATLSLFSTCGIMTCLRVVSRRLATLFRRRSIHVDSSDPDQGRSGSTISIITLLSSDATVKQRMSEVSRGIMQCRRSVRIDSHRFCRVRLHQLRPGGR
jgi:hypothetical protein